MDRIVRPAIYQLTLALRPDGRPLIILTPPQLMLVRNSIATIIQVLDFVRRRARVTDDIGALSFVPALPELLDLQMLLFAYYENKEPPPLLGNILSHSLLLARSSQLFYLGWGFRPPPISRYKKKYVIPGGIFPGPNKIVVESFLFPGLYYVAALMKEGLKIWDASEDRVFTNYPFLLLATADGPGVATMNGLVGHTGAYGCRLFCPVKSRHKSKAPTYYPALLKPDNYTVAGCDHADISCRNLHLGSPTEYRDALFPVIESKNQSDSPRLDLITSGDCVVVSTCNG
ncbi:hypothetical protein B0H14DRAFT_3735244 [Mycena olivaceomarginata]|nr:hypothetical protein B0H14DRAFT_3735244 [Mycena olivaceomarginata]